MKKVLLTMAFLILSSAARAHEWYPHHCCNDKDCQPIPPLSVAYGFSSSGEEGYWVHLMPGEHKMIDKEFRAFVPMRGVKDVPDTAPAKDKQQWYACIGAATKIILCFWRPQTGA